jgi:hypothetical protein
LELWPLLESILDHPRRSIPQLSVESGDQLLYSSVDLVAKGPRTQKDSDLQGLDRDTP